MVQQFHCTVNKRKTIASEITSQLKPATTNQTFEFQVFFYIQIQAQNLLIKLKCDSN